MNYVINPSSLPCFLGESFYFFLLFTCVLLLFSTLISNDIQNNIFSHRIMLFFVIELSFQVQNLAHFATFDRLHLSLSLSHKALTGWQSEQPSTWVRTSLLSQACLVLLSAVLHLPLNVNLWTIPVLFPCNSLSFFSLCICLTSFPHLPLPPVSPYSFSLFLWFSRSFINFMYASVLLTCIHMHHVCILCPQISEMCLSP